MAKTQGVRGWHSMRKDQLVRALVRAAKAKVNGRTGAASARTAHQADSARPPRGTVDARRKATGGATSPGTSKRPAAYRTSATVTRRLGQVFSEQQRRKDLAHHCEADPDRPSPTKDRVILMVRDPYWLHATWEITRSCVNRAHAAMAEHWHTCRPVLRLLEVDSGGTTSTAERIVRDIEIHGDVCNWYIDVQDPPRSFRVELGYLATSGRFFVLARSESVTTPRPGSSDDFDDHWADVARHCDRIFVRSIAGNEDSGRSELQEVFEERLRRPMGPHSAVRFGAGAEGAFRRKGALQFAVDADMIIHGTTQAGAHVTLSGDPVKLNPDGSFVVRLHLPDRRQVIPLVASTADGVEQRTIVLAVERNTKLMEPIVNETVD